MPMVSRKYNFVTLKGNAEELNDKLKENFQIPAIINLYLHIISISRTLYYVKH